LTNVSEEIKNRALPEDSEIMATLDKANKIENPYFRLRVRALIGLVKKFGKRRAENVSLRLEDLEQKEGYLYVTFTLKKKHKKGLFQFIKLLKKQNPEALTKPLSDLEIEWRQWTQTESGYTVKEEKRTKKVSLEDKYARLIIEYLDYLKEHNPKGMYLFPSGKAVFSNYYIDNSRSLSGRQLLRLIKPLNKALWLHLFRELKGSEIAKESGNNIIGVYEVKETLDLEQEATAWNYIHRYAAQEMKPELA
jgi:integrase